MNDSEKALWQRLESFQFDRTGAAFPFSERLARENGWTPFRAQRVLREYKRFLFLACAAGHPVSPSHDVDQAWHLHLTYTESYWSDLCAGVLKQRFHHQPTAGGDDEKSKFDNWYANTLASYEKFFGEPAPADLWPRGQTSPRLWQWVDVQSHWVLPKPRWPSVQNLAGAALILFAVGCGAAANPFNLPGPDFLIFYSIFCIAVAGVAFWYRRKLMSEMRPPAADGAQLHPCELAYLAGRERLAVASAIASLEHKSLIELQAAGTAIPKRRDPLDDLHPLERTVFTAICASPTVKVDKIIKNADLIFDMIRQRLADAGAIYPLRQSARVMLLPTLLSFIAPVIGVIKIIVGISRDRPIAILAGLTFTAAITFAFMFGRRPFQTPAGKQLLGKLRKEDTSIATMAAYPAGMNPALPGMAVALYGMDALYAANPWYRRTLQPPASADGVGSASCGGDGGGGGGAGCGGCGGGSS